MSQNALIEKIEADAKEAIDKVKSNQSAAIADIEKDTQAQIAELEVAHQKQLEKKLAHLELVAVSRAKQSANIAIQSAKRTQIDEVFEDVASELVALPSNEYVKFFSARVAEVVPKDCAVTAVNAPEKREQETAEILKQNNLEGKVVADKSVNAGLIIHTKDGVYDVTLNRLFAEHKADMEMDVVAVLSS